MFRKIITGFIAAAAITAFSFTAPGAKKETKYAIDSKSTTSIWIGKKVTGEHTGGITISKGAIFADGNNIKSGSFEFDMNSITCTDITDKTYSDKLVGHLKADDFFGSEKYPTASFELTKAVLKSGNDYEVSGKLTIKGVTEDITFPALIKMDAKTFVAVAKITVNRTKYGIKYGSASFIEGIGDKAISDDFELNLNLVANAK